MNSQRGGLRVASVLFALFALGHVVRLATQAEVLVAGRQIGLLVSVIAALIAACLSLWLWRLSSQ
jgi:hypothetical protein